MASRGKKGDRTYWHQLVQLSLREVFDQLEFSSEVEVNITPLRADFVVAEARDVKARHPIGHFFRRYNTIEFKSPQDSLQMESFKRGLVYVVLHQILYNPKDDKITESTLTFICTKYPERLFEILAEMEVPVIKDAPIAGIYQIESNYFPIQVVVLDEIDDPEIVYPFAPFISGEVRKKAKILYRLIVEMTRNPENERLKEIIAYSYEHNLFSKIELEEVLTMARRSRESIAREELLREGFRTIPEWQQIMQDTWEDGQKKGIEKGRRKGLAKGVDLGVRKGKAEVVRTALVNGVEISLLTKITGLSEKEIMRIKDQLTL